MDRFRDWDKSIGKSRSGAKRAVNHTCPGQTSVTRLLPAGHAAHQDPRGVGNPAQLWLKGTRKICLWIHQTNELVIVVSYGYLSSSMSSCKLLM